MARCIADSLYWKPLWKKYRTSPSIALCRVPEIEDASQLKLTGETLDHCCGDAVFASLTWPEQRFTAGCDINKKSLDKAAVLGKHARLDACDAGQRLPYDDARFDLVFNNSALEHIPDLDTALAELGRITRPGGEFAFNVLNHRYFEWWPLGETEKRDYRDWQPFFHALNLAEWTAKLRKAGFEIASLHGYFEKEAAQVLATLDFEFSGFYIKKRPSALVAKYQNRPRLQPWLWQRKLSKLVWQCEPDAGAGYFFRCKRT